MNKKGNYYENLKKSKTNYMSTIRNKVYDYMRTNSISIPSMAERCGIPLPTLNTFLYGQTISCKLENAIAIAKEMGISIDELAEAGTLPEITMQNIQTCRKLPQNSLYLVRWFINHQRTLYLQDEAVGKKIISVMQPITTNDGILKPTNNFRQIDISSQHEDTQAKVFIGLQLNCDFFMPIYSPYDVLLIANDRNPFPREHVVLLCKDCLFLAHQKIEQGKINYYGIRDGKFKCDSSMVDEFIGYVTGVIQDVSNIGSR